VKKSQTAAGDEAGVVRGKTKQSLEQRLAEIHDGVAEVIASLKPAVMALEQLYSHVGHPRTSILMGHAGCDLPGGCGGGGFLLCITRRRRSSEF